MDYLIIKIKSKENRGHGNRNQPKEKYGMNYLMIKIKSKENRGLIDFGMLASSKHKNCKNTRILAINKAKIEIQFLNRL